MAPARECIRFFSALKCLCQQRSLPLHALFGLAKESQDAIPIVCIQVTPVCPGRFSLGSDTSFATAVGAGFDIKLAPFVKLRLFQVDYVRTQLHGATQNQARASAGFVFYF